MKIFISSTTEDLAEYRLSVISSLLCIRHTPVCMEIHTAMDMRPKDQVLKEVAECDVYIGIFAWRYGFIPQQSSISITESEYREALEKKVTTLIFLLDEKVAWPDNLKDRGENGQKIKRLRNELTNNKWVSFFTGKEDLVIKVLEAVAVLPSVKNGSKRKHDPIPLPIPEKYVKFFQDRHDELSEFRQIIYDIKFRMVMICGQGGIGKTTLATKMILELRNDSIGDRSNRPDCFEGFVFVSLGESCYRTPDRIIELVSRTLPWDEANLAKDIWNQGETSIHDKLAILLRGPLSNHRCVIVLDNLESVLDNENRILPKYDTLKQFIETILEYDHFIKLIITSRQVLSLSPEITITSADRIFRFDLDNGLPEEAAIALLRAMDQNDSLGIQNAKEDVLKDIVAQCSYIPRTLESLIANLRNRPTWKLETLLANKTFFSQLIENPARELYSSLASDQDRIVLKVLAVYGKPVNCDAVRYILPALQVEEMLDKLYRRFIVKHDKGLFWLHSLEMQYVYNQIPDAGSDYSKKALHEMAANYFRSIPCTPKAERTSFDEIIPLLNAVEQLFSASKVENAAKIFIEEGLHENLYWWGYFILLADLCNRFLKNEISLNYKIKILAISGKIQRNFGNLKKAKDTYERALTLINTSTDPTSKISLFIALGDINQFIGDLKSSFYYHQQAEQLLLENPDPLLHSENKGDTANALLAAGRLTEAQEYYEQAIEFSHAARSRIYEGIWSGNLGRLFFSLYTKSADLNHREGAISYLLKAIEISIETADRRHESHWNSVIGNLYRILEDFENAERHLKRALSIASRIGYYRMIKTQAEWLVSLYIRWIQRYIDYGDFVHAREKLIVFRNVGDEIGMADLDYSKALDQLASPIYYKLGTINAQNGNIEDAISDYGECIKLNPTNLDAALSRIEVLIWAERYDDAKNSLESLKIHHDASIEKIIHAWLMCHISNLGGQSFYAHKKILEEAVHRDVKLEYDFDDIEPYLNKLDKKKLTELQVKNIREIQELIHRIKKPND